MKRLSEEQSAALAWRMLQRQAKREQEQESRHTRNKFVPTPEQIAEESRLIRAENDAAMLEDFPQECDEDYFP